MAHKGVPEVSCESNEDRWPEFTRELAPQAKSLDIPFGEANDPAGTGISSSVTSEPLPHGKSDFCEPQPRWPSLAKLFCWEKFLLCTIIYILRLIIKV